MRASENSEIPKEFVLYELPVVLGLYPQNPKLREHGAPVVARPSIAAGLKYEDVSRAYIQAVHSVLTGQENASVAAAALEKELIAITGFRPAPLASFRRKTAKMGMITEQNDSRDRQILA